MAAGIRRELRTRRRGATLPPGSHWPSARHTHMALADPLGLLIDHQRRFGPVFTVRVMHDPIVWVIGPEANHHVLVSDFDAFEWRHGYFSDLWPLLGDGLLNIDGPYHRAMRRLLLPAFHRERVEASVATMVEEAGRAADALEGTRRLEVYAWTRQLALRIALRALLGIDPRGGRQVELAHAFEQALSLHGHTFFVQLLRGPGTPYNVSLKARAVLDRLIREELAERRARGEPGPGTLGLLLAATDEHGAPLTDDEIRDQAITLLFAGHDTTTATFTFLLYELGRAPAARERVERELDAVLGARDPAPADLDGTALPELERALSETLRRYPPAWVGPRRSVRDVEICGVQVPAGVVVQYSSWATHHLPEVFEDPLAFVPDRFLPEAAAALPRGAYIPFGGGSRMCLGKRFGQYELRTLAAVLLRRLRFAPDPAGTLKVVTTPTLGPAGGLWFDLHPR